MKKERCPVIGLTGGIASGKSTVLGYFARHGAKVISSDEVYHRLLRPGGDLVKKIAHRFGKEVVRKDGSLDRRRLGDLVFRSPVKRRALERITHPAVMAGVRTLINKMRKNAGAVVVDVPLLFEAGVEGMFDRVIVVWAPKTVQVDRLRKRSSLGRRDIERRIGAQMPLSRKRAKADYVIDNSGSRRGTRTQIKKIWGVLTNQQDLV